MYTYIDDGFQELFNLLAYLYTYIDDGFQELFNLLGLNQLQRPAGPHKQLLVRAEKS